VADALAHPGASAPSAGRPSDEGQSFLDALLAGSRARALAAARSALAAGGGGGLYDTLVRPAPPRGGELWDEGRILGAAEGLATSLAEVTVASLYGQFPWPVGGPGAIVACVEGERHAFGARVFADLLALDGWDAAFLGADVPVGSLVALARRNGASMVALSVT